MWQTDDCYRDWGVDGTDESILRYLGEIEHWCPRAPDKINVTMTTAAPQPISEVSYVIL